MKRNVLVIGGSSSIGDHIVHKFGVAGDSVICTFNSKKCHFKENVSIRKLDLENSISFESFCSSIPKLDIVIFVSGILPGFSLEEYNYDVIDQVMKVNFINQAELFRHLLPQMNSKSSVIMVSSISAKTGSFDPIYAASKGAQISFIKSLAKWHDPSIRFNSVSPSLVEDSKMCHDMSKSLRESHKEKYSSKRLTTKEEVASSIYDLCGPDWFTINGKNITICGGQLNIE